MDLGVCVNVCVCEITSEEGCHEFEKEHGWIYGRVFKEKNEGINDVIIISKTVIF